MTRIVPGMAMALVLFSPLTASAHFGLFFRPAPVSAYYSPTFVIRPVCPAGFYTYPSPVWVTPTAVICPPAATPRPLAVPQPAPPSTSAEPPLAKPQAPPAKEGGAPAVRESRYYDAYKVALIDSGRTPGERCSVGFWNLSERDLVLHVGGRSVALKRGKSVTFDVARQFVWQVEGRQAHSEHVPDKDSALEIVIRR